MICLLAPVSLSAMYILLVSQSVQKTRFLHRARPKGWSSSPAEDTDLHENGDATYELDEIFYFLFYFIYFPYHFAFFLSPSYVFTLPPPFTTIFLTILLSFSSPLSCLSPFLYRHSPTYLPTLHHDFPFHSAFFLFPITLVLSLSFLFLSLYYHSPTTTTHPQTTYRSVPSSVFHPAWPSQ